MPGLLPAIAIDTSHTPWSSIIMTCNAASWHDPTDPVTPQTRPAAPAARDPIQSPEKLCLQIANTTWQTAGPHAIVAELSNDAASTCNALLGQLNQQGVVSCRFCTGCHLDRTHVGVCPRSYSKKASDSALGKQYPHALLQHREGRL